MEGGGITLRSVGKNYANKSKEELTSEGKYFTKRCREELH